MRRIGSTRSCSDPNRELHEGVPSGRPAQVGAHRLDPTDRSRTVARVEEARRPRTRPVALTRAQRVTRLIRPSRGRKPGRCRMPAFPAIVVEAETGEARLAASRPRSESSVRGRGRRGNRRAGSTGRGQDFEAFEQATSPDRRRRRSSAGSMWRAPGDVLGSRPDPATPRAGVSARPKRSWKTWRTRRAGRLGAGRVRSRPSAQKPARICPTSVGKQPDGSARTREVKLVGPACTVACRRVAGPPRVSARRRIGVARLRPADIKRLKCVPASARDRVADVVGLPRPRQGQCIHEMVRHRDAYGRGVAASTRDPTSFMVQIMNASRPG